MLPSCDILCSQSDSNNQPTAILAVVSMAAPPCWRQCKAGRHLLSSVVKRNEEEEDDDDNVNDDEDNNNGKHCVVIIDGPSLVDDIMRVGIMTTSSDVMIPMRVAFLVGDDDFDDGEGGTAMTTASALPSLHGGRATAAAMKTM